MLRSHHLYCMAIYIEKTCEVRSSEIWEGVSWGYGGDASTLWGHRPGFRCLAVFGVGGRSVGGSQVALWYLWEKRRCVRRLVPVWSLSCGGRYGGTYMWLDGVLSGSWPHM